MLHRGVARALISVLLLTAAHAAPAAPGPLVAILDSGVDPAHPAIAGRLVPGYDFVHDDPIPDDVLGHGTMMAAIVLARGDARGACRECRILPLKVAEAAGDDGHGVVRPDRLAPAIRRAVERGAHVILVGSGSVGLDPLVAEAVALAEAKGIPVIAPAGGAADRRALYPAALPTVIAAAAEGDEPASGSGAAVAPGAFAMAGVRGGEPVACSGSSVAAARIASTVACLLARRPAPTPGELRTLLRRADGRAAGGARAAVPAGAAGDRTGRLQYSDRAGSDIVMDAPWRTVRDTVPILFFFPQFEAGRRVERIRVVECPGGVPVGSAVVVDAAGGPDTLNGATFVGPLGEPRGGLEADERVTSFWHYVVRVPHAALSAHRVPDVHELRAEVEWTTPALFGRRRLRNHRVLRVVVDPAPFPSFDPADRYYDTHAHTIAEQTTTGAFAVDGAAKAYAAPVVMLLESAYALGMLEIRPSANGWRDVADRIVVTDHNMFYSREPYDAGAAPPFGPTAATDGHAGEAAWYRANLGRLAGEEVTLRRGSNQDGSLRPNLGHHLLAYDAPHVEGPWHGGHFLTSSLENPNTLESVLAGIKAAGGVGFVYASHPHLGGFVWPPEYYAQAVGLPPYHSAAGAAVDPVRGEFLFKGAEVWNSKVDAVARASGRLPASSAFEAMNPFPGGPAGQRFVPRAWDGELRESLDTLFAYVGRGLRHAFREAPGERFVRKLYLSGGSDAHGDFNYTDEVPATIVPYSGALNRNAWASVRTYALVHERPADSRDAVAAFRDGNTVITDGPLVTFALDGDGRHHPAAGAARWHDAGSRWEEADGRIGGHGRFDGGGTVLVPLPGDDVWVRSEWRRSVTPDAGDIDSIRFDRLTATGRDTFRIAAGPPGVRGTRALPVAMDRLGALVATARDPAVDERCITNPVWVAPVRIEVTTPPGGGADPAAFLPAGSLRVVFRFPNSMSRSGPARVMLRPLDSLGVSTDPAVELVPDPGWEDQDGVAASRLTVANAAPIPAPAGDWDAGAHARVPGLASYVVYLERPTDLHGNVLNDVARAFTLPRAGTRPAPGSR